MNRNYSVAIRTLGTSGEALKRELESLHSQSIRPQKIVIYIARGYPRPDFRVGMEEYVEVDKGMVAQRALPFSEISDDKIMLLDDDLQLPPDFAERLIGIMDREKADCVAADIFENHKMDFRAKIRAFLTGWVRPHYNQNFAFCLHSDASFSYISNPLKDAYLSQSAAGPASLWNKDALLSIDVKSELWLDQFGFAYGDDELIAYKLHVNGGRLMVAFNTGITYLDAQTASSTFHADTKKFYIRSMANYIRWHRMHFVSASTRLGKTKTTCAFGAKLLWLAALHLGLSAISLNPAYFKLYYRGIRDGKRFVASEVYKSLPPYKNDYVQKRLQTID